MTQLIRQRRSPSIFNLFRYSNSLQSQGKTLDPVEPLFALLSCNALSIISMKDVNFSGSLKIVRIFNFSLYKLSIVRFFWLFQSYWFSFVHTHVSAGFRPMPSEFKTEKNKCKRTEKKWDVRAIRKYRSRVATKHWRFKSTRVFVVGVGGAGGRKIPLFLASLTVPLPYQS